MDQAIIGFFDILGYREIVKNHMDNMELIRGIENIIMDGLNLINKAKEKAELGHQEVWKSIVNVINAKVISDSIIFTFKISQVSPNDNDNISNHLHMYFMYISAFCLLFIGKMGHIFRGSFSIGSHYENNINNNLFIFSQAYINAFDLEGKAEMPRIVIGENLLSYLKSISFPYMHKFFYDDKDRIACFDLYCFSKFDREHKKIFNDIKNGLISSTKFNITKERVLNKLKYFVEYHNNKMGSGGDDFKDCIIDTNIFNKK